MPRIVFLLCCTLLSLTVSAQHKPQISVYAGSGFSFFAGPGAVSSSVYYRNGLAFPNAVDTAQNPFGKNLRSNFIAGGRLAVPLNKHWNLLLDAQYENTGATMDIHTITGPGGSYSTNGTYNRHNDFLAVNPRLARMFQASGKQFYLHGGVEYGFRVTMGDQCDFTDNAGVKNSIGHSGGKPEVNDFRLTAGAGCSGKKWGIDINYKHGLTDYRKGNGNAVYLRALQAKLTYSVF